MRRFSDKQKALAKMLETGLEEEHDVEQLQRNKMLSQWRSTRSELNREEIRKELELTSQCFVRDMDAKNELRESLLVAY